MIVSNECTRYFMNYGSGTTGEATTSRISVCLICPPGFSARPATAAAPNDNTSTRAINHFGIVAERRKKSNPAPQTSGSANVLRKRHQEPLSGQGKDRLFSSCLPMNASVAPGRSFTTFSTPSPLRYTGIIMIASGTQALKPTFLTSSLPLARRSRKSSRMNNMPITGK